jgi:uncharacterized protein YcbK (DUF882 family)
MDAITLKIADEARDFANESITPSSACRCRTHNTKVTKNPSSKSQHLFARAMDLPVSDSKALYNYLCKKYPNQYGFGLYNSFVHVDTRTNGPARWDKSTK